MIHRLSMPVALGLASGALLLPVFTNAVQVWADNPDLHFGFLLVPTAAALVWYRRAELRQPNSVQQNAIRPLVIVLIALAIYLACERVAARSPAAVAAGLVVCAEIGYLLGWRSVARVAFPVGLATYGLALQPTLIAPVGFELQGWTAVSAEYVGRALGLPIVRDGLLLRGDTFAFVIADSCSGMNSLLALLCLAGVWAYLVRGRLRDRVAIVTSVLPLTILANTTRVVLVLLIAAGFGQDTATGVFHSASSIALFCIALLGLLGVSRMLGCRIIETA